MYFIEIKTIKIHCLYLSTHLLFAIILIFPLIFKYIPNVARKMWEQEYKILKVSGMERLLGRSE